MGRLGVCAADPERHARDTVRMVVDAAAGEGFMDRVRALSAPATGAGGPAGALIDRRGVGLVATAAELFSLEAPILVVCADLGARREGIERLLAGRAPEGRLAACEWVDLLAGPPSEFGHLLALDPPVVEYEGPCEVVAAWGEPEIAFALEVLERRTALRRAPRNALQDAQGERGELAGRELEAALRGPQKRSYDPRICARLLAVLAELELAAVDLAPGAERCRLLEQRPTSLESSATFTAAVAERDRLRSGLEAEQTALSRRRAARPDQFGEQLAAELAEAVGVGLQPFHELCLERFVDHRAIDRFAERQHALASGCSSGARGC